MSDDLQAVLAEALYHHDLATIGRSSWASMEDHLTATYLALATAAIAALREHRDLVVAAVGMDVPHQECIQAALGNRTVDPRERTLELRDEVRQLREWVLWIHYIKSAEPCHYDHHDYCQTHYLGEKPCPNERATAFLAAILSGEASDGR